MLRTDRGGSGLSQPRRNPHIKTTARRWLRQRGYRGPLNTRVLCGLDPHFWPLPNPNLMAPLGTHPPPLSQDGCSKPTGPSVSLTTAAGSGRDTDPSQDSGVCAGCWAMSLPSAGSQLTDTSLEAEGCPGGSPPESEGTQESRAGVRFPIMSSESLDTLHCADIWK